MAPLLAAVELDRGERPELVLLGAVVLAALFIFTRPLRQRLVTSERAADSLFAGMASAYVFVVLIPELHEVHELLGDRGYLVVLGSFVAIYGVEHSAHVVPILRRGEGEELILLWLRAAMLWAYGFLFLVTVPDVIAADLGFYAFTLGVGALAVAFKSYEVSLHHPRVYQRYGRWLIATGPVAGGLVDLFVADPSELLIDVMIAIVAGFIMLLAFTGSLLDHNRTKFGSFTVGVGLYVLAFLGRFTLMS